MSRDDDDETRAVEIARDMLAAAMASNNEAVDGVDNRGAVVIVCVESRANWYVALASRLDLEPEAVQAIAKCLEEMPPPEARH